MNGREIGGSGTEIREIFSAPGLSSGNEIGLSSERAVAKS